MRLRVIRAATSGMNPARLARYWRVRAARVRRRSRLADHVWRAVDRYRTVGGGHLAAAIAYYGFFATFALGVLSFTVLGLVLRDNQIITDAVERYLRRNLPQLSVSTIIEASRDVGWLAVITLTLAGLGWVEALRSSQRAIWGLPPQPGNPVLRRLFDVVVLIGLGVLLTVSICVSTGVQDLVLRLAGTAEHSTVRVLLRESTVVIAGGVDFALASALLVWVPRLRPPWRRLLPSALVVVAGLALLKTVGQWYLARAQHNPAYQVVAGAVGVLLFMYLFSQLVLIAAALAATSRAGQVRDLAGERASRQTISREESPP